MTAEQQSINRERRREYYRRRKNASTGERVKLDHDRPQEGPTNFKGPNQLPSQGECIQGVDQISQHSGVTIVEYDVNINHLLSLLRQHIESEFSRFTGNYLPVTLEVDGRTFRVNIVGNPDPNSSRLAVTPKSSFSGKTFSKLEGRLFGAHIVQQPNRILAIPNRLIDEDVPKGWESMPVVNNEILRRYFLELTTNFLAPFGPYLRATMPFEGASPFFDPPPPPTFNL
ncbi:hypothetical protein IFM89_021958 [Coptis chinensis]|uniref:Uncharacterized protein n=1 Tax=Coptis chinensis TaxID=261450 RepID=A0A835HGS8_9MAGN|nr:hypothetical protein IFM89_021958 [Coptis chinensis]